MDKYETGSLTNSELIEFLMMTNISECSKTASTDAETLLKASEAQGRKRGFSYNDVKYLVTPYSKEHALALYERTSEVGELSEQSILGYLGTF